MQGDSYAMTSADAEEIEKTLSFARLRTYYPPHVTCASGETQSIAALRLYRWNIEAAAAMWPVMHLFEVTVRNAVSDAIAQVHGTNWTHEPAFHRKLPRARRDPVTQRIVGYGPYEDLCKQSSIHATPGKVIPELKMVFWEKMFTSRHDSDFWNLYLSVAFPNLPRGSVSTQRNQLRIKYESVRRIRNRLGHHESVSDPTRFDLSQLFENIMEVLAWRSPAMQRWALEIETVRSVLVRRPD